HAAHGVGHLAERQKADIRQPEQAGRGAETAEKDRLQAGRLDQSGRENVVRSQAADDAGSAQQVPQSLRGGHLEWCYFFVRAPMMSITHFSSGNLPLSSLE